MVRCAQCDGKFGLTRHRWYNVAFCSKHCREKYLDKLARDRACTIAAAVSVEERAWLHLVAALQPDFVDLSGSRWWHPRYAQ